LADSQAAPSSSKWPLDVLLNIVSLHVFATPLGLLEKSDDATSIATQGGVMPDATRRLERVPDIISGTAFSDGHVAILSDGGKVTLEIAGHRYTCGGK
jgi:hypothetical protein